jgi:hypothetical protein
MPVDPRKRELRKLKRTVKRAGSKHRRRELKKQLADDPEGAADAEGTFGKFNSATLNGLDQDVTRRRVDDD